MDQEAVEAMIKIVNAVEQMIIDEKNIFNPILKAHTAYVLKMTVQNLDNAILKTGEPQVEILTLKEWYAKANE